MNPIISISGVGKTYASGHVALGAVDLDIREGEIFALLGPNGAGKTTLISVICGLVTPSSGTISVAGHDIIRDYKAARSTIGLVPQELHTDAFEKVIDTVQFSRGLFGKPRDDAFIEKILRDLTLWDKRNSKIMELSGGMKRRVMIAKALAHEPRILFLDEPTAGVDVELRKDMWRLVRRLRETGVTIILTTHYIEEAEEMADRVGVINKGQLLLVDDKDVLMHKLGTKTMTIHLDEAVTAIPEALQHWNLNLVRDGRDIEYTYDATAQQSEVPALISALQLSGVSYADISTRQSTLEDIFVGLVHAGDVSEAEVQA
ncbi:MAG: ABC transporter ATP-binding protein [Sphingobium sp.]|nr:ABC transporter ATP-binding protein [Sphingobium sp.]MCP5398964.1 ABC transporter ATP-binding protein [Sphingomonas sp.]